MCRRLAWRVSDHHHLEQLLGRATVWAYPIFGDVLPAGAGRNAVLWQSEGFVLQEPAPQAYPPLKIRFGHLLSPFDVSCIYVGSGEAAGKRWS